MRWIIAKIWNARKSTIIKFFIGYFIGLTLIACIYTHIAIQRILGTEYEPIMDLMLGTTAVILGCIGIASYIILLDIYRYRKKEV